jgi:hypothetical protein
MGWLQRLLRGEESSHANRRDILPGAVEIWQKQSGDRVAVSVDAPQAAQKSSKADVHSDMTHDTNGRKIIPEVYIEHVETHISGDMKHIELWVRFKNNSPLEIEIRRVNVFGLHGQFSRHLRAGEVHEEKIYSGDSLHTNSYHTCEVQFKITESGDYFQANHEIRYHYDRDEHGERYVPNEMLLIRPIRGL